MQQKILEDYIGQEHTSQQDRTDPSIELYKIYEFADGLYFPDMKFRCGSLENYVKTGVLTSGDVEEIWNENASSR